MKTASFLRLSLVSLALALTVTPAFRAEDIAGGTVDLGGGGGSSGPGIFGPGGAFDNATDAVSKPLDGLPNDVADNGGFGQGLDEAGKAAQGQAGKAMEAASGSNGKFKEFLGSNPGSKNMEAAKTAVKEKAGFLSKVGAGLQNLGKAIDIVSPISSILGAWWGGGKTAAKWEAANQAGKFGCTKGGAAAGTAVGGPLGAIGGAAAGEAAWNKFGKPKVDAAAQSEIDAETQATLGGAGPRTNTIPTNIGRTPMPTSISGGGGGSRGGCGGPCGR